MTFLKLFLICTFRDSNLAEKLTNLAENLFFKVELRGVLGVRFFQFWSNLSILHFSSLLESGLEVFHGPGSPLGKFQVITPLNMYYANNKFTCVHLSKLFSVGLIL